jgi:hypothetical protein
MRNEVNPQQPPQAGQVFLTPEGGPVDQGVPASAPGAGQVQATPEAGPLPSDGELAPPTWRENMRGPILGLEDVPTAPPGPSPTGGEDRPRAASTTAEPVRRGVEEPSRRDLGPLKKQWPPYTGKPVTAVSWEALRYVAPVASQAEKLAIQAIDLSARGLTQLARYLEARRQERNAEQSRDSDRLK